MDLTAGKIVEFKGKIIDAKSLSIADAKAAFDLKTGRREIVSCLHSPVANNLSHFAQFLWKKM